jgi:hypothetical protein
LLNGLSNQGDFMRRPWHEVLVAEGVLKKSWSRFRRDSRGTVQGYGNRGRPLDPRTRANVDALLVIGRSGEGKNGVAGTRRREE